MERAETRAYLKWHCCHRNAVNPLQEWEEKPHQPKKLLSSQRNVRSGERLALLSWVGEPSLVLSIAGADLKWLSFTKLNPHLLRLGHSGFLPQFLFRFETSSVLFMSRKSDISQGTIDYFASKMISFFAFFALIDQFWCQIINWLLRNISFATHKMNAWCFKAKPKMWKKSTV